MPVERFTLNIPEAQLIDLHRRLSQTRWPVQPHGTGWERGTRLDILRELVEYWTDRFDWRKQEAELNRFDHYHCTLYGTNVSDTDMSGTDIHFLHVRGNGPAPLPLILTHGWPDSFLRYLKIIPLLTDPARFGGDPEDAFDVIIPSLPGYGFSGCPPETGVNNAGVAKMWHQLMTQELGYARYGAAGGDIGSGVTRYLALGYPQHLIGIHLTDIGLVRDLLTRPDSATLSAEERNYQKAAHDWIAREGAYMNLQATRPWTLACALNDSPAGLASWIIEKFRVWSDCGGDLTSRFSEDELLTNIMLYWLTGSAGSAASLYYENAHSLPPMGDIGVPTGLACFPADILPPPESWARRHLNIVHWTNMPRGGHFTAMEEPELMAEDIRRFFRRLRAGQSSFAAQSGAPGVSPGRSA